MNINDYENYDKYSAFRDNLQYLLKTNHMSGRQLCLATGISTATMSRYLNAQRIPDMTYIYAIADYFNISIDWLLGRTQPTEQMPENMKDLLVLYQLSSSTDKLVIKTILDKYKENLK